MVLVSKTELTSSRRVSQRRRIRHRSVVVHMQEADTGHPAQQRCLNCRWSLLAPAEWVSIGATAAAAAYACRWPVLARPCTAPMVLVSKTELTSLRRVSQRQRIRRSNSGVDMQVAGTGHPAQQRCLNCRRSWLAPAEWVSIGATAAAAALTCRWPSLADPAQHPWYLNRRQS